MRVGMLLCALSIVSFQAAAAEVPQVQVSYRDLNLDHPANAQVMYRRIDRAAARACEPYASTRQLSRKRAYAQCHDDAVNRAVASVNHPVLNQYAATQTGIAPSSVKVAKK